MARALRRRPVLLAALLALAACGQRAGASDASRMSTAAPRATSAATSSVGPSSTSPAVTAPPAPATSTTFPPPPTTAPPQPRASAPAPPPVPPAPAPTPPTTTPAAPDVEPVTAAQLGPSWRPGRPVGPADLRLLRVPFVGFDGLARTGALIVHRDVVDAARTVFARLAAVRFPIRQIVPIDAFAASDAASLAADNTAAFNCRLAVDPGAPPAWSEHAYGRAIDVNPVENPYVYRTGTVDPPAGAAWLDRTDRRPGMAYPGSPLNDAFAQVGWGWGGLWAANPDYQHFAASGS